MTKQAFLLTLVALGALTACQSVQTKPAASAGLPPYEGSADFERMKSLVGKWSGESPEMGKMSTIGGRDGALVCATPPSEPDVQISRIRLSGQHFAPSFRRLIRA